MPGLSNVRRRCNSVHDTKPRMEHVRIQEVVGLKIAEYRAAAGLSQTELGERLSQLLGRSWPRQSVWAAEHGKRDFTAAELAALVEVLRLPGVDELLVPPVDVDAVDLGGAAIERTGLPRDGGSSRHDALRDALQLIRDQAQSLGKNAGHAQAVLAAQAEDAATLRDTANIALRLMPPDDQP
jgi:transcriptional regulator with XRE-family HTH domain